MTGHFFRFLFFEPIFGLFCIELRFGFEDKGMKSFESLSKRRFLAFVDIIEDF